MASSVVYPLITGNRFDASSIEIKINNKRYIGCTEIDYEQTLEPAEVRGMSPQVLGFTRGIQKCGGRIVMLREEFQDLSLDLITLSVGLLEANFLGMVTYSELPPVASVALPLFTSVDTIVGMRITGSKHRVQAGSAEPLTVELPFVARYIMVNGIPPLNNLMKAAFAASAA